MAERNAARRSGVKLGLVSGAMKKTDWPSISPTVIPVGIRRPSAQSYARRPGGTVISSTADFDPPRWTVLATQDALTILSVPDRKAFLVSCPHSIVRLICLKQAPES